MVCPHCQGAEDVFSRGVAREELESYRKKGPKTTTRLLINALKAEGVTNLSLLDIGGGVGAIQHAIMTAGASQSTDVDASTAYLNAAKSEAENKGYADSASYLHGDFVQMAGEIEPADIVTLDRVICCYPDVQALVQRSSERAKQLYGVVYPRDNWILRGLMPVLNFLVFRLQGNPFRTFIHRTRVIDSIVQQNGFQQVFHRKTLIWQVYVYKKISA